MFFRIITLMFFIIILVFFIKYDFKKAILGYYTFFNLLLSFISCIAIESGIYISELQTNSYSTGGYIRLFAYLLVFLVVFELSTKKERNIENFKIDDNGTLNKTFYKYILIFSMICIAYLYLDMIIVGIPLLHNTLPNKYNYFIELKHLPIISKIYSILIFYLPSILGIIYQKTKKRKTKNIILIIEVFLSIYVILLGFKVSGLRNIIIGFLVPILYIKTIRHEIKFDFKLIKKFLFLFMIFIIAIMVNYYVFSNGLAVKDKLFSRVFALTSHFWWVTDEYRISNKISSGEIVQNFKDLIKYTIHQEDVYSGNVGVTKLMYKFAPATTTYFYLKDHVRMGASFITVSVYDFGYIITFFIVILCAFIYSKLINSYGKSLRNCDFFEIILYNRLLIYFEVFLWSTGTITEFLNAESVAIIIVLLIYNIIKKRRNKHDENFKKD